MLGYSWIRNFIVAPEDVDFLTSHLLETETPLTTEALALLLIEKRLQADKSALEERYHDAQVYNPAQTYTVGTRLLFSKMDFATGIVRQTRQGENSNYGTFEVIAVEFDEKTHNPAGQSFREFASSLTSPHALSTQSTDNPFQFDQSITAEQLLDSNYREIITTLQSALQKGKELMRVAGYWFPRELVMDVDVGSLHLAEAVLDMANGGPLRTADIIEQIGGIGNAPEKLQVFSLNVAMSRDDRFDEVGPAGEVLWYLNRMEPEPVRRVPDVLQYKVIPYEEDLLTDDMIDLETELDDELTDIEFEGELKRATSTLLYPHRRAGTLPLNAKTRTIFPRARTPRIYVELIDTTDGEKINGWVVHEHKYVYGLDAYYAKHRMPVGAQLTVERGTKPGQILLSYDGHKPRTEWIKIFVPSTEQVQFENKKRSIGAVYDDLLIFGVDDLASLDTLVKAYQKQSLVALLRMLLRELGKLTPQGTVHVVTLYSLVNVFRRCPPGPVFALLQANADFEDVGNHYWKLAEANH